MITIFRFIFFIAALFWFCNGTELRAQKRLKVLGQRFDSLGVNAPILPTIGPFRTDIPTTATVVVALVNDKDEIDTSVSGLEAQVQYYDYSSVIFWFTYKSIKGLWYIKNLRATTPEPTVTYTVTSATLQASTTFTVSALGGATYSVTVATLPNGKLAAPGVIKYYSSSHKTNPKESGSMEILQLGKRVNLYGTTNQSITLIARDRMGKVPMQTRISVSVFIELNESINLKNDLLVSDAVTGKVEFDKLEVVGDFRPIHEGKPLHLIVWFDGADEALFNLSGGGVAAPEASDSGYISFTNIPLLPGEPFKFMPILRRDFFSNNQRLLHSKIEPGTTLNDTISVQLVDKWNNPVTWYQGTKATLSLNEPFKLASNSVTSTTAVRGMYHFPRFTPLGPKSIERGDVKLTIKNPDLGISYLDSTTFSVFSGIIPYFVPKQMSINKRTGIAIYAADQFGDVIFYPEKLSLTVTVLPPYTTATQSVNRADSLAELALYGFNNFVPGEPASMKEGDVTLRFTALPSGFTTTATTTFVPATGIRENFSVGGFTLAPNPCSEFVTISATQHNIRQATLVIYDLLGNIVLRKEVDFGLKAIHTIHLGNLATGAYSLSLMTAQGLYSTSLMVVK